MKILNKIRQGSELFVATVVYNNIASKASCNSEVFSRIEGLTIGLPGTRRHA